MTEAVVVADAAGLGTSSPTTVRPNVLSLTGVRFFAAAAVVVFHFRDYVTAVFPALQRWEPVAAAGGSGVDLFFILSGFIISYNYADRFRVWSVRAYREFLILRLARMYPVHLVTLLLLGGGVLLARTVLGEQQLLSQSDGGNFLGHLLLIIAWRPDSHYLSWNYPAWSISAEWFAYLLFPLVVVCTAWLRTWRQALAAAVAVLGVFLAATNAGAVGGALPRVLCEFVAGTLLAKVFTEMRPGRRWDVLAMGAALGGIATAAWSSGVFQTVVLVYVFAALVLCLSRANGPFSAVLASGPVVLLGEASYSLYMTHGVVDLAGQFALPWENFVGASLLLRSAVLLTYLVALAAATGVMYAFVEKPARRWIRDRTLPARREPAMT
jgi:peptidoglycan/LPS O-acetylase OafA/YrhL